MWTSRHTQGVGREDGGAAAAEYHRCHRRGTVKERHRAAGDWIDRAAGYGRREGDLFSKHRWIVVAGIGRQGGGRQLSDRLEQRLAACATYKVGITAVDCRDRVT